ncbi:tetratricopeptide repeat protein [Halobacillus rhizosphaerae]|uniref:helix-turn-helix domain-containing protein n=1 Tax=Halobacillus rhizosphaerae TaxID=3064889 RepID=UPI00398B3A5D
MNIGKRIYVYRKIQQLTLVQLAEDSMSVAHLSKIENGHREPSSKVTQLIGTKLKLPPRFFYHYGSEDREINYLLTQIHHFIIEDLEKAAPLLQMIDDNYYDSLSCVKQEVYFLLLKGAYLYKKGQLRQADQLYEDFLLHYLTGEDPAAFPRLIKEAYYYFFGLHYYRSEDYDHSLQNYHSYLKVAVSLPVKAAIHFNIALLLKAKDHYERAIDYCSQALYYYEVLQQPKDQSMTYNLMGTIYKRLEDFEQAMNYLNQGEELALEAEDLSLTAQIYHNKAILLRKQNHEAQALTYLEKTLSLKLQLNKNPSITYHALCKNYLALDKPGEALQAFQQAKLHVTHEVDYYKLLDAFLDYYKLTRQHDLYVESLEECIDFFEQREQMEFLKPLYKKLAQHYYEAGKYKRSSEFYQALTALLET